jgi:hypothetical protein
MSDSDDVFGEDPGFEQFADEFDRRRKALFERLEEYMDEEDLDDDYMGQLLLDALVRLRMAAYGTGVERPSVAGLKLDLDRLRNEVNVFLREAKKGAEEYIGHVKDMRAEADAKFEAEGEEENKNPE